MPGTMQKAVLECGCCGVCVGCCFPTGPGPNGEYDYPEDIPFSIDAPNCSEIDGYEDAFSPLNADDVVTGECGGCARYPTAYAKLNNATDLELIGTAKFESGPLCTDTPCSAWICFALECWPNTEATSGLEDCCARLRLVVGLSDPYVNTEPEDILELPGECPHVLRIAPTSCSCDEYGGLSAVFDLSLISFACKELISGGPCDGNASCCTPDTCDLTDATLTI